MTTLYPRLSEPQGRILLGQTRSKDVETLKAQAGVDHPSAYHAPTGGVPAGRDHLQELSDAVRECAEAHGYPAPASGRAGERLHATFDRALARVVFEKTDMTAAEAASAEVWTFMAVRMLPDVVKWRWDIAANDERWLGRTLVRHTFARVWWQAFALATGTGPDRDYTLLDGLSESDLNQIFERRGIGGCPTVARALTTALIDPTARPPGVAHRDLVRDVTKRISRLLPFTSFLGMDEQQLQTRMRRTVAESAAALAEAR